MNSKQVVAQPARCERTKDLSKKTACLFVRCGQSVPKYREWLIPILVIGLVGCLWSPGLGGQVDKAKEALGLLSVGNPGPNAIGFQVWTNKEPGEFFSPGDRIIVHFQADREAYVAVLSVDSRGGITVIFPTKGHPKAKIEKDRLYTLFGNDSPMRMKLGEQVEKAGLAFYVSPTPFTLEPLKPSRPAGWITITADDTERLNIIRGKLDEIAQNEGFNRVTLSPRDKQGSELNIKLVGRPLRLRYRMLAPESVTGAQRKPVERRLPQPIGSEKPEDVDGVQGEKAEPLPDAK